MTVEQVYESAVSPLPRDEQIRLARYIVWKLTTDGPWTTATSGRKRTCATSPLTASRSSS